MVHITKLFPGGKKKVVTISYDDGFTQDIKLVEILNKYRLKATFNLNSGLQGEKGSWQIGKTYERLSKDEAKELYKNHEVAIHTLTHPHLESLPKQLVIKEILEDKINLEELVNYPVRGMAYPFGTYDEKVLDVLKFLGIEYSRTVNDHEKFILPENFLLWNPTCHHTNPKLMQLAEAFLKVQQGDSLQMFYLWGHSYEFDELDNWKVIENFSAYICNNEAIWYATNIEIVEYLKAVESIIFSSECSSVYNPTALPVWISVNNRVIKIMAGETKKIII